MWLRMMATSPGALGELFGGLGFRVLGLGFRVLGLLPGTLLIGFLRGLGP